MTLLQKDHAHFLRELYQAWIFEGLVTDKKQIQSAEKLPYFRRSLWHRKLKTKRNENFLIDFLCRPNIQYGPLNWTAYGLVPPREDELENIFHTGLILKIIPLSLRYIWYPVLPGIMTARAHCVDSFLENENARKGAWLCQMRKMCVTGLSIARHSRDL